MTEVGEGDGDETETETETDDRGVMEDLMLRDSRGSCLMRAPALAA